MADRCIFLCFKPALISHLSMFPGTLHATCNLALHSCSSLSFCLPACIPHWLSHCMLQSHHHGPGLIPAQASSTLPVSSVSANTPCSPQKPGFNPHTSQAHPTCFTLPISLPLTFPATKNKYCLIIVYVLHLGLLLSHGTVS